MRHRFSPFERSSEPTARGRTDATTTTANPARLHHSTLHRSAPAALPCPNYYKINPHKVGPMGNVVFTNRDELLPWLAVACPVPATEAEKEGGCIVFYPPSPTSATAATPSYYRLPKADDDVYGHAMYIPLPAENFKEVKGRCRECAKEVCVH